MKLWLKWSIKIKPSHTVCLWLWKYDGARESIDELSEEMGQLSFLPFDIIIYNEIDMYCIMYSYKNSGMDGFII